MALKSNFAIKKTSRVLSKNVKLLDFLYKAKYNDVEFKLNGFISVGYASNMTKIFLIRIPRPTFGSYPNVSGLQGPRHNSLKD